MASAIPTKILIAFLLSLAINHTLAMGSQPNGTHRFGTRVENDRLLYRVENPAGNPGFFNFKYNSPEIASGPLITCVEIAITDIFNQTHAYIASGGIGEKSIVTVLSVLHNTIFSYEASIYGL